MNAPYFRILITILLLAGWQITAANDGVPSERLKNLQQKDSLSEWLLVRMDYALADPGERMPFLLATQKEIWRKPQTKEEREIWLNLLLNQGYYLLYNGSVTGSINAYEQASDFYHQNAFPDFDVAEYLYKPLGNNYTRLGDYSSALFIQNKGLEYALSKKNTAQAASFYNNLAISYRWIGDLKKATSMAMAGIAITSESKSIGALLRGTLADILFEKKDLHAAEKYVLSAITQLQKKKLTSNEAYWLLSAYTLSGNIAMERKQFAQGFQRYRQGLDIIQRYFDDQRKREKANLLNLIAKGEIASGNPQKALVNYNQTLSILIPGFTPAKKIEQTSLYAENRLFDALEGRSHVYLLLGQPERALDDMLLALHSGDLSRNIISAASDKLKYQRNYNMLVETALKTAYGLWKKTNKSSYAHQMLMLTEQAKARLLMEEINKNQQHFLSISNDSLFKKRQQLLQAMIQAETELASATRPSKNAESNKQAIAYELAILEKEIDKKYPSWRVKDIESNFPPENILRQIPAGTVVFTYFLGESTGYNLVLKNGKVEQIKVLEDAGKWRDSIQSFMTTYFRNGPAAMMNTPQTFFSKSQELTRYLMPDWKFSNNEKLLIIPDDVISYLSFESLLLDGPFTDQIANWPFVVKQVPVTYAYSLRTWLMPRQDRNKKSFAGFFLTEGSNRGNLQAARAEEEVLSKEFRGSFFMNKQADLVSFRKALENSDVLHISTHSFLSGKDQTPALEMWDGNYYLFQLAENQSVPALVVMSACRTADGLLATGEGVQSLSRGFTAAGTDGTIAGLWNLNDQVAAQITAGFYKQLSIDGDPGESLHKMKLEWLNRMHNNPAMYLPYYWAGMVYIGKPQKIEFSQGTGLNYPNIIIGAGILLILGGGIYFIRKKRKSKGKEMQKEY